MANNIKDLQIELIQKKFNVASLLIGIVLIGLGVALFVLSRGVEGNMLSSAMIFLGILFVGFALFFLIAKLNSEVYSKTNSPIVKRQLYYDTADFYNIKNVIDNNDYKSIEKFKRVDEFLMIKNLVIKLMFDQFLI